ncbi:UDP-N-acetylmuramoyl-L-alanyl-D-glutamate--2,6-diaminopimelate ligase [bacterium]|nr:UDP-N-acetylmuramoyl-L-alanyl-D-glutamate--2,6-diaminopimelate ligase [bacterium]
MSAPIAHAAADASPRALEALLADCPSGARVAAGVRDVRIGRVVLDSRRVEPGDLFVGLPGSKVDGASHAASAFAKGAAAVAVADEQTGSVAVPPGRAVVACRAPRAFVAEAAASMAGHPSRAMTVVAVTGTSGKTTTTWLLESMFVAAGHPTGVLGTIEYRWGGRNAAASLTTPDAVELQGLLARMRGDGVTHVALEASSHALALDRLCATSFDAGVFTNLSRDHLDFHADLDEYREAKARLFLELLPSSGKASFAVVNASDPEVEKVAARTRVPCVRFGPGGDVRCTGVVSDLDGMRGEILLGDRSVAFSTRLVGAPHASNIEAAAATAWRLGIPAEAIVRGIADLPAVPGRLESVRAGQPFRVVVDYAHKPDALERVLASLRGLCSGRLITVFGCGGDRDAGKRPLMGAIAARLSDIVILTSDNPRTENPMAILAAIEEGVRGEGRTPVAEAALGQGVVEAVAVVPERRTAILRAIEIAGDSDLVLIAGKGHEDYQIVGTTKHHLDDREEARAALAARGWKGEPEARVH